MSESQPNNSLPAFAAQFFLLSLFCLLGVALVFALGFVTGAPAKPFVFAGIVWVVLCALIGLVLNARFTSLENLELTDYETDAAPVPTERLADSFMQALITVSPRQKIIYMNTTAQELFPNVTMGQSLSSVISHPGLRDMVDNVIAGRPAEPIILHMQTPVEQHFRITASLVDVPVPGDSTHRSRAILVLYDVTEIERANALRADFLANASHELKTPIASLLGYIETLNGHAKDDPEARTQFLGIMQQQAERMQRLIDDLLSLRRIEQTEHIAPTETGDLFLAARAAKESVAPMAETREVKTKYSGSKKLPVIGKQDELVQLVLNIVDNAVQMSPAGSKVLLTSEIIENWQPGDGFRDEPIDARSSRRQIIDPPTVGRSYTVLRIRDSGPGFAGDHLPRLTERFYRIAGDRQSHEKGTGLGLAIVKHILLRHRGGLFIETAEGIGTEFTLFLPTAIKDEDIEPISARVDTPS